MEPNNENDVDTNDESRTRLHRLVLTIMQEGANQRIKPRTEYDHRISTTPTPRKVERKRIGKTVLIAESSWTVQKADNVYIYRHLWN